MSKAERKQLSEYAKSTKEPNNFFDLTRALFALLPELADVAAVSDRLNCRYAITSDEQWETLNLRLGQLRSDVRLLRDDLKLIERQWREASK